ncbi:hypothetical protein M885DRAFT_621052 [Pelagophyceae sp. CCMP2097]|nr:hypothetical protein M885DRAFT_621052 [Pelagophyceae sp. CCMP2097]
MKTALLLAAGCAALTVGPFANRRAQRFVGRQADAQVGDADVLDGIEYDDADAAGHDYIRDRRDLDGRVDVDEVDKLLAERLTLKKQRDFDGADALRDELLEVHNVVVNDRARMWQSRTMAMESSERREQMNRGYEYTGVVPVSDELKVQVTELLDRRADAKWRRDFDLADELRDEIYALNVEVRDREKTWRVRRDEGSDWSAADEASTAALTAEQAAEVTGLLKQRSHAKLNRDFESADAIRQQLLDSFDVVLNDRQFTWRVGAQGVHAGHDYARDADDSVVLSEETLAAVDALLSQRLACKKKRDFAAADDIQADLTAMNVRVDDRRRIWCSADADAARAPRKAWDASASNARTFAYSGPDVLDAAFVAQVQGLLEARGRAKAAKDYATADALRAQLGELNINVRDKERTWAVAGRHPYAFSGDAADARLAAPFVAAVDDALAARAGARRKRQFEAADALRDQLADMGVVVSEDDNTWRFAKRAAPEAV